MRQRIHQAAEDVIGKESHRKQPDYLEIGQVVDIKIRQRDGKLGIVGMAPINYEQKGPEGAYSLEGLDGTLAQANVNDLRPVMSDEDAASEEEGGTVSASSTPVDPAILPD